MRLHMLALAAYFLLLNTQLTHIGCQHCMFNQLFCESGCVNVTCRCQRLSTSQILVVLVRSSSEQFVDYSPLFLRQIADN